MKKSCKNSLDQFVNFQLGKAQGVRVKGGNSDATDQTDIVIVDTITT